MSETLKGPRVWHPEQGIYLAPVRHHSPACALALRTLIRDVKPRQVLIEAPADFVTLLPVLLDPDLVPPVAVVAFRKASDENAVTSYYPLSRHAPEMVALLEAQRLQAHIDFIDLPTRSRLTLDREPPAASATVTRSLTAEAAFTCSDYVAALCRRTGCRDQNELWDHLFESRIGATDWRRFFQDVGTYCAGVRATVCRAVLARDSTLAREAHMVAALQNSRRRPGPIVVVTGGLHTPALADALDTAATEPMTEQSGNQGAGDGGDAKIYVVRYGFRELDRLNGYASGMPSPGYYDALWQCVACSPEDPPSWRRLAADLLSDFAEQLRRTHPSLRLPLPALSTAIETAVRLAELRNRPGPLRTDVLDAALNAFVKGEVSQRSEPIIEEFVAFLRGAALGNVPPSAGSPPLVEAVRAQAVALGFDLRSASSQQRKLDVYRSEHDLATSRFLHALSLLAAGFGTRRSGPDPLGTSGRDLLFEVWTASWSPMVEGRLIEVSRYGDTLEAAALGEVHRVLRESRNDPARRNAMAAVEILSRACQAGLHAHTAELAPWVDEALTDDPDIETVGVALSQLYLAWQARALLGLVGRPEIQHLVGTAYRRALELAREIDRTKEERQSGVLRALVLIRQVVASAGSETPAIDADLFDQLIDECLARPLLPLLAGAMAGMGFLAGRIDARELAARVRGQMAGAHATPKDNVAAVSGLIAVSPDLLGRVPEVVDDLDDVVSSMEDRHFIAALPHLRLAFAALNPRETDAVAALVSARHGAGAGNALARPALTVDERELIANLELDRRLQEALAEDGLGSWLPEGAR